MYGYTNEAGEPIMSGEAYRFECALDDEYAREAQMDYEDSRWADYEPEPINPAECDHPDVDYRLWHRSGVPTWEAYCGKCDSETTNLRVVTDEYGDDWHEVIAW